MVDVPKFDGLEQGESSSLSKGPGCPRCGDMFRDHDKERVYHDNGTWSYDYVCE